MKLNMLYLLMGLKQVEHILMLCVPLLNFVVEGLKCQSECLNEIQYFTPIRCNDRENTEFSFYPLTAVFAFCWGLLSSACYELFRIDCEVL